MVRQNGPYVNPQEACRQTRPMCCGWSYRGFLPNSMALAVGEASYHPQHGKAGNGGWGFR